MSATTQQLVATFGVVVGASALHAASLLPGTVPLDTSGLIRLAFVVLAVLLLAVAPGALGLRADAGDVARQPGPAGR